MNIKILPGALPQCETYVKYDNIIIDSTAVLFCSGQKVMAKMDIGTAIDFSHGETLSISGVRGKLKVEITQ